MITIEYAKDARGREPGREFISSLSGREKSRILRLIELLQTTGRIKSYTDFKNLGDRGQNLWEFKAHQARVFGDFRPGGRFVIAGGHVKKQDWMSPAILSSAARVLHENDARLVAR